jgi:hypothetical protein
MRYGRYVVLILMVGCGALQTPTPIPSSPAGVQPIVGGLTDQRPYYGSVESDGGAGDFLMATCGCGSWKALMTQPDGTQWQVPVRFYTPDGADQPDVTAFGREQKDALLATLYQADGQMDGRAEHGSVAVRISAVRRETHSDDAQTCVRCHAGADPIFPLSSSHPTFTVDPPNCLTCHTVVISP